MGGTAGALNFLEENLVSQLVAQHKDLRCKELQMDRVDVVVGNPQEARKSIRLPVGLAVTIATVTGIELVFFRIQDHLRRMGRARCAESRQSGAGNHWRSGAAPLRASVPIREVRARQTTVGGCRGHEVAAATGSRGASIAVTP
jgi:hypothetical protein